MSMFPQRCNRCRARNGVKSRIQAWVGDFFSWDRHVEEILLCGPCRVAAAKENGVALGRRSQKHWAPKL